MKKKKIKKHVLSREEREGVRADLRRWLYEKGAKQCQSNRFEMTTPRGVFLYSLGPFACHKLIQVCDFSRGKVLNKKGKWVRAKKRLGKAGNHNPYSWEVVSTAHYHNLLLNFKKQKCSGFIRY
jgi:hypothetical protein